MMSIFFYLVIYSRTIFVVTSEPNFQESQENFYRFMHQIGLITIKCDDLTRGHTEMTGNTVLVYLLCSG